MWARSAARGRDLEIPSDFDACMPHRELPLTVRDYEPDSESPPAAEDEDGYGKIVFGENPKPRPQKKKPKKNIKVTVSKDKLKKK